MSPTQSWTYFKLVISPRNRCWKDTRKSVFYHNLLQNICSEWPSLDSVLNLNSNWITFGLRLRLRLSVWPFQISRFLITLTTKGSFFLTYWNEISYRSRNNRNNTSSPIFKYLFLFLSNFLWGGPCNILPHTSRHSNWYIRNFLLVCKFQLDKKLTPNDILKILSFTTHNRSTTAVQKRFSLPFSCQLGQFEKLQL